MNFEEQEHFEETYEGVDASGQHFVSVTFDQCEFSNCNFRQAIFEDCRFSDCTFERCDLTLASVPESRFGETSFKESTLIGLDWSRATWRNSKLKTPFPIDFKSCQLDHSIFAGLIAPELTILDCSAKELFCADANLFKADFSGSDLSGSIFQNTRLEKADFSSARNYSLDISQNVVKGARFSLPEALGLLYALNIEIVERE